MVRKKNKATPSAPHDAFTPTRRSARINNAGPAAGTPGERFRNISAACSDFVAVAEIVTNVDRPLDDVVLSPPPTKRSKNGDSQFVTKATINVADFPLPSAVPTQRDKTSRRMSCQLWEVYYLYSLWIRRKWSDGAYLFCDFVWQQDSSRVE